LKNSTPESEKLSEAIRILQSLGFSMKQTNEVAGYTLLALLNLHPTQLWKDATSPLMGITPIIQFINDIYGVHYAPNTRETIRDEAVKHFAETGLVIRNPDDPSRPTTSGKFVYQIEPHALDLFHSFGSDKWDLKLKNYTLEKESIKKELERQRNLVRVPIKLPSGEIITLSPGGQNPLIKMIVEGFCSIFAHEGILIYIGDTENKFRYLEMDYLKNLGVIIPPAAKMPDVVVHDILHNWLILIEAVTSAGPVDGKRRKELKDLFSGFKNGLVFVTAFVDRDTMRSYLHQISWETEVWIAEYPDHLIHFNGERFLGPYPDTINSLN